MKKVLIIIVILAVGILLWQVKFSSREEEKINEANNNQIIDALISLEESGVDNPYVNIDNWPVYRNNKYKFTIKYPTGWNYLESYDEPTPHRISPQFKVDYISFRGERSPELILEIHEASLEMMIDEYNDSSSFKEFGQEKFNNRQAPH